MLLLWAQRGLIFTSAFSLLPKKPLLITCFVPTTPPRSASSPTPAGTPKRGMSIPRTTSQSPVGSLLFVSKKASVRPLPLVISAIAVQETATT